MIILLVVGIPAILITAAALVGAVYVGLRRPRYDIDAETADYHRRRNKGDSLAVMTADEPEGVEL